MSVSLLDLAFDQIATNTDQMLIIGVVGGIASGKSLVSASFEELGAIVLDADRTGHQVLDLPEVRQQLRGIWGDSVFREDGSVDRKKLGGIVFHPTDGETELSKLEQITHPLIRNILEDQVKKLNQSGEFPVAILDAPVMFKAGWNDFCDQIVFVESNEADRCRLATERGWSELEFARREASQVSIEIKRAKSDWIVLNGGSIEDLRDQVAQLWANLVSIEEEK